MGLSVDDYVQAYLTQMRAPLKQRTVFGQGGKTVVRSKGERILLGPNGQPIRVVEDPEGGTQIEHGDHLHAVIRPQAVTARGGTE
jgi:hypothetical protein